MFCHLNMEENQRRFKGLDTAKTQLNSVNAVADPNQTLTGFGLQNAKILVPSSLDVSCRHHYTLEHRRNCIPSPPTSLSDSRDGSLSSASFPNGTWYKKLLSVRHVYLSAPHPLDIKTSRHRVSFVRDATWVMLKRNGRGTVSSSTLVDWHWTYKRLDIAKYSMKILVALLKSCGKSNYMTSFK
jgi:hypothetical protein